MRTKHYYFGGIMPYQYEDGEKCFLMWYRYGGRKRGDLRYKSGKLEELERFAADMIDFKAYNAGK